MRPETRRVKELFKCYKSMKKDEQTLLNGNRADSFLVKKEDLKDLKQVLVDGVPKHIYPKHILERFSPDVVNPSYFWKQAAMTFPCHSVSSNPEADTIEKVNQISLKKAHMEFPGTPLPSTLHFLKQFNKDKKALQVDLKEIDDMLEKCVATEAFERAAVLQKEQNYLGEKIKKATKNKKEISLMEIGPGFGCVKEYLDWYFKEQLDYHAIDVYPMFEYDQLYKCNGKRFPKQVYGKRFDAVYSVNVFQHLSVVQRRSYYREAFRYLKEGGLFTFSVMAIGDNCEDLVCETPEKKKQRLFGISDEDGNYYIQFFSQFTKLQRTRDVMKDVEDVGFTVVGGHLHMNTLILFCKKFTKK